MYGYCNTRYNTGMKYRQHILTGLVFALLLFNVYLFSYGDVGELSVSFLDVGQGDAVFIESPNGTQVLVDGGYGSAVLRELSSVMDFTDNTIDMVVATHPDADHIGGLPEVFERFRVDTYMHPDIDATTQTYRELVSRIEKEGSSVLVARREMLVDIGGGAYMVVLFPDRDVSRGDANDGSVILKVVYGDTSFLLTGDAGSSVEEYLVGMDSEYLDVDVLKAGHHGSKTSSSEVFIEMTTPEYVVISAGEDNRYGHPHQEVLDVLGESGAVVLGTYEEGKIEFISDGKQVRKK